MLSTLAIDVAAQSRRAQTAPVDLQLPRAQRARHRAGQVCPGYADIAIAEMILATVVV